MPCGAVIPAAGGSTRFGRGDKTMLMIAGRPVLDWVLETMIQSGNIDEIVIAVSDINQFPVVELIARMRPQVPVSAVAGGDTRRASVRAGVEALDDRYDLVLVHDAARPLVSVALVQSLVDAGRTHGAAIPGVQIPDTVKQVSDDQVVTTLDRRTLIAVQTPQVFRRDWLMASYRASDPECEATDEASILEAAGYPVHVVPGDPDNIKVTTPTDVIIAESLLAAREIES